VAPDLRVTDDGWATGPQGLYLVRDRETPAPSLWLRSWAGEERKLADLPLISGHPAVAIDPRTGALVFPRILRHEADIALLDVRSGG
jgi:hypothetical protein